MSWETDCDNYVLNQALAKYDVPEIDDDVPFEYCEVCGRLLHDTERVIVHDGKTYCEGCYE
jgi:formylmethanofuran dehydrogenase subunit E